MFKIRYQSKAVIPGMIVRPYVYYPNNSTPTLFPSLLAAERVVEQLPKSTAYEIVSPFNTR